MSKSRLQADGLVDWAHGFQPRLHVESSGVNLEDALSWYRAIRPGVAEDLRAEGMLGLDVTLGGWPIQLERGAVSSSGAIFSSASLPAPLHMGAVNASVSSGGLSIAAAEISFPASAPIHSSAAASAGSLSSNSFIVSGSLASEAAGIFWWPRNWNFAIQGKTPRVQDWLLVSGIFAEPLNTGWTAEGGLAINMRGTRKTNSATPVWLGTMDLNDLSVSSAYVNQPVLLGGTHVAYTPLQRTITLAGAEALGATWHGSITRKSSAEHWTFDLSADHVDAAELDRWLGPRARPGFLARFTGFGSDASVAPQTSALVDQMAARGRLRIGEITMASLPFDQFDGDVEIAGRAIQVHKAQADFFGGNVSGKFDARLLADPSYEFQGRFDRVNLAQLASAMPFWNDRIAGTASATLSLAAHGIGRGNLVGSMEGSGALNARNAQITGLDLTRVFPGSSGDGLSVRDGGRDSARDSGRDIDDPSSNLFASVQGIFRIRDQGIDLANFVLDHPRGWLQAEGRIDFSHALSLRIRPSIFQATTSPSSASPPSFLIGGTIEDPKLILPPPAPALTSGTRGR